MFEKFNCKVWQLFETVSFGKVNQRIDLQHKIDFNF